MHGATHIKIKKKRKNGAWKKAVSGITQDKKFQSIYYIFHVFKTLESILIVIKRVQRF
jgi:hypothetical protein